MAKDQGGRPATTKEEKKEILRKLGPYLQAGLSVNKACLESQIPKSTVFDIIQVDTEFAEEIMRMKQFVSVVMSNTMMAQLRTIIKKQNPGKDKDGNEIKSQALDKNDLNFLKWFATHSNQTREEFTERKDIGLYDPEAEIKRLAKIMDETADKDDGKSK